MLVIFGIIYISIILGRDVTASNIEDLKKEYMGIIVKCMDENPLTPTDIEGIQNKKMPETEAVKCLIACAFKKSGMMDDKGNLSAEGVIKASKTYFSDDPNNMQKTEDFINACKGVNDVPVSDGDKGCERAALLYKCSLEKSPDLHLV